MSVSLFVDHLTGLERLRFELVSVRRAAFAVGTWRNLHTQWFAFLLFCIHYSLPWLPASRDTLCLFAQFLSRSFRSVSSIRNYVSAIRTLHSLTGYPCPDLSSLECRLTFRGLARIKQHVPRRASPITPAILLEIAATLDFSNDTHLVFWTLFLVAFFSLARKSNLVANTAHPSPLNTNILRSEVTVSPRQLLLHFKWTKTLQFGGRELIVPLLAIKDSILCPVRAYVSMCRRVPARPSSPAFVIRHGSGVRPVTYSQFQSFLKSQVSRLGLDPARFSSHSFRRGGANWAFRSRVPTELLKQQGDWRSDAYLVYLEFSLEQRQSVAAAMIAQLRRSGFC